jgi:large subunit ribosomal protein L25
VQCLPGDLPEFIEVDLSKLDLGQSIHVAELGIPGGVEIVPRLRQDNPVVVTATLPRAAVAEEPAAAAAAAAPAAGAPAGGDKK